MILKLAGAASVIIAATLIGLEMSQTLKRRVENIESFISSMQYMENAIDFTLSPINEIIETLSKEAKGAAGEFFKELSSMGQVWSGKEQVLSGGETGGVPGKWHVCLVNCKGISRDDKAALGALGAHLGTSGKDAQIATLRLCQHRLNTLLECAKQEFQANGKMLKGLGFFGGILITITLI